MWTRLDRLPLSRPNLMIFTALLAGLVTAVILQLWLHVAAFAVTAALGALGVWWARRPNASDVNRVDAIEYRDERDRTIARDGFAILGAVALLLAMAEFLVAGVLAPASLGFTAPHLLVLCIVWGIGNRVAARRH